MTRRARCKRRRNSVPGGSFAAESKKIDSDCGSPILKDDIAEKPLDSPKITKLPSTSTIHVDLFSQARKALSFRSPFDSEDSPAAQASIPRANNLPTRVSNLLCRHSDHRKRHKKLHSGTEKKSSASVKPRGNTIWQETEDYFRELTVEDIERLENLSNYGDAGIEKCFLIPYFDEINNLHSRLEYLGEIHPNASQKDIKLGGFVGPSNAAGANLMLFQNGHSSVRTDGNAAETKEFEIKFRNSADNRQNGKMISDSFSGVEWILGSRSKIYLSSERPSKKRKHMSRDAGLEKLLTTRPVEGLSSICHYCSYGDMGDPLNCLIRCSSCGMVVHQRCYGVQEDVDSFWLCSWCKSKNNGVVSTDMPCLLCPKQGGALKPVKLRGTGSENDGSKMEFAHLFCCLWMPEVYLENTRSMEPIMNVNELKDTRKKLICSLCKLKYGTCVRCSNGSCRISFHPICAREARYRLEIWGKLGSDEVELRAFCSKHSEVQHDGNSQDTGDSSLTSDCVSNDCGEHLKENNENSESLHANGGASRHVAANCSMDVADDKDVNAFSFSLILKRLIDLGKVSAEVVASEIGVTPHSLTMALTDKHNNPDLHCKLVRWLISHAHFGNLHKSFKQKIKLFVAMKEKSDVAEGGCACLAADSSVSDTAPVKSIPRRRTKSSLRHVKDNDSGASNVEGDHDKILIDSECKDIAENGSGGGTEAKPQVLAQFLPGEFLTAPAVLKIGDLSYGAYVHPLTQRNLAEAQNDVLQKTSCCQSSVLRDGGASQSEPSSSSGLCCKKHNLLATSDDVTSACEGVNLEELSSARNQGIIKLSPADEVEGELIYYQQRLIQNSVLRKRLSDELISRIVRGVTEEVASAGRQKWDSVLVNQYNHYQRENKKHGRNERRHKEAQAVLAAATAAAATSSRISSTRKDKLEESSQHEDLLKMKVSDSGSGFHPQLNPCPKESIVRSAVTRSSSEKDSRPFQSSSSLSKSHTRICDVCNRYETVLNPVLVCSGCKVSVHFDCYRSDNKTTGPWRCELCEESSNSLENPHLVPECGLCGGTAGAFRKSRDGLWMHALCAEWLLDSTYQRGQIGPVEGIDSVCKGVEVCAVCHRKQGVCVKCCYGHCHIVFHPICARSAAFYMNVRTVGGKLQHKAYCEKHSIEQRAKAEKHGIEELKTLKQVRVELERLRLLCERIVKREKLKRELLVCSHDVLASSRDSVLSTLVRHPFYQPEVSSESATTSLKGHMSCNEMVQRADNSTVDCTVAGKRRVRLPLPLDNDQRTDDSSASQELPPERVSFSGKQIPQRPSDDEEKKPKFYW